MEIKDLEIYRAAEELSDMVWNIVLKWDSFSKMTIGRQLVEAADGISANIAEGFGRYHFKENRNFCYYARGSLEETKAWLRKGVRRNLLDLSENPELTQMVESLPKRLNAYIKTIGSQRPTSTQSDVDNGQ
jgi:four helix bundle protein